MIERNKNSEYWRQLSLIYRQIDGLESGFQLWKTHNHFNGSTNEDILSEVLMLNLMGELSTLERALMPNTSRSSGDHCSAIVKPLADGSDLFVAHNTWSDYDSMLRIMKKYSFAFKQLNNKTKPIAGHSVSFPSYPGVILSIDDYYVLSSGLVVQETTIHSYNTSLDQFIRAEYIVLEFVRNIIANRLADSGQQWTQLFSQYNSGTYNNQFMIIDYKLFKRGTKLSDLPKDLLWVIEQMPNITKAEDLTHVLRAQGYWASYNVPYFGQIFQLSGEQNLCQTQGSFYCWSNTSRARIFRREQSKVTDLKTMYSLMRYNDFKRDPLSQCRLYLYNKTCIPPYSSDLTIAARNDLNDPKGDYPLEMWGHRGEGAIDAKIVNIEMVSNLEVLAVSGPTDQMQPPFQWSKSGLTLSHSGLPDIYNFKPIHVKWFPNRYENKTDFK